MTNEFYEQPYALSATRVAQGMGIFNVFVQAEGSKELSLEELDAKTKGDKQLLCIFTYSDS